MKLFSPMFENGGFIPVQYTCDGPDISPPIRWSDVPEQSQSLALICEDPDAPMGTWVHWVIYEIPADSQGLPEGLPKVAELENGIRQGLNDFGRLGYGGPCPPRGIHRYFFKLYALDSRLNLPSGLTKDELLDAIKGHIIDEAQLMGRYGR